MTNTLPIIVIVDMTPAIKPKNTVSNGENGGNGAGFVVKLRLNELSFENIFK